MVEGCVSWNTLANFLGGVFHQDMGSPESALEEYLAEATEYELECEIRFISEYLNRDIPESAKNDYIASQTWIYFPAMRLTPVEWLRGVLESVREELARRRSSVGS